MNAFKRWLLVSPVRDSDFFFTRIRRTARLFHNTFGHRWATYITTINGSGIKKSYQYRTCVDCYRREEANDKGEWVTIKELMPK